MTNKMKSAFGSIRADDKLKAETLAFLQSKARPEDSQKHRPKFVRLVATLACLCIVAFVGVFLYEAYFTKAIFFVDVDINPSVELAVNRFDQVIDASAYNADGEALLSQLSLMHQPYDEAVNALTDAAIQNGFLADGGLVSVTVQAGDAGREPALIEALQASILSTVQGHHRSAQVDVFPIDDATRTNAHDLNLSPAKYLAILELQKVDPTASFDGCREHSIGEIHSLAQQHGGKGHHGKDVADAGQAGGAASNEHSETDNGNTPGHGEERGHGHG